MKLFGICIWHRWDKGQILFAVKYEIDGIEKEAQLAFFTCLDCGKMIAPKELSNGEVKITLERKENGCKVPTL